MSHRLVLAIFLSLFTLDARAGTGLSDADRKDIEATVLTAQAKAPKLAPLRAAMANITRNDDAATIDAIGSELKLGYAGLTAKLRATYDKIRECATKIDVTLPDSSWIKTYRTVTQGELNAIESMIRENQKQEIANASRETGIKKDIYLSRAQAINAILINTFMPTKDELLGSLEAFSDTADSVYSAIEVCQLKYAPLFVEPRPLTLLERLSRPESADTAGKDSVATPPKTERGPIASVMHSVGYFALNNVLKNAVLLSAVIWSWRNPPVGMASTAALGWYWFFY